MLEKEGQDKVILRMNKGDAETQTEQMKMRNVGLQVSSQLIKTYVKQK